MSVIWIVVMVAVSVAAGSVLAGVVIVRAINYAIGRGLGW